MSEALNTGSEASTTPAPEGHDQSMIDAVDKKEAELQKLGEQEQPKPEGEKLLGKFNSVDDLAKAYQELERKQSEQAKPEDKPEDKKPEDQGDMTEAKAEQLIEKSNIDLNSMAERYYQNGNKLGDDDYKALEDAGIPREYVDGYLKGVEAEGEKLASEIMQEIGGEEHLQQMIQWAVSNMSQEELQAYNAQVDSGDPNAVRAAVRSLAYSYEKANGSEPNLLDGESGSGNAAGFQSVAQLTEAMRDPRYATDPAYRADVEKRLAVSNIF